MTRTEIKYKLKRNCIARELDVNDDILDDEIDNAIEAVNERRNFIASESRPYDEKYSNLIYKLALFSITKIGAEGETSHNENNIYRTYQGADYPSDLLNQIIPLVRT